MCVALRLLYVFLCVYPHFPLCLLNYRTTCCGCKQERGKAAFRFSTSPPCSLLSRVSKSRGPKAAFHPRPSIVAPAKGTFLTAFQLVLPGAWLSQSTGGVNVTHLRVTRPTGCVLSYVNGLLNLTVPQLLHVKTGQHRLRPQAAGGTITGDNPWRVHRIVPDTEEAVL